MADTKKEVIAWCAGISALMVLFPPLISGNIKAGYGFLFTAPYQVNLPILAMQIVFVWFAGLGLSFVLPAKRKGKAKPAKLIGDNTDDQFRFWFINAWKGALPLWQAYWVGGVLGSLLFYGVLSHAPEKSAGVQVAVGIAYVAYMIWSAVSIWRCAENTGQPVWKYLARVMVVLGLTAQAISAAGLAN